MFTSRSARILKNANSKAGYVRVFNNSGTVSAIKLISFAKHNVVYLH
jgi:hypothetical protein